MVFPIFGKKPGSFLRLQGAFRGYGTGLFLPESWDQDRERCHAAGIPDEVVYRPKWEIGWCPSIIDVLRAFIFKSYENEEDFLLESRLNLENGQFG